MGLSTFSLEKRLKLFADPATKPDMDFEAENRQLKCDLAKGTEVRDPKQLFRVT